MGLLEDTVSKISLGEFPLDMEFYVRGGDTLVIIVNTKDCRYPHDSIAIQHVRKIPNGWPKNPYPEDVKDWIADCARNAVVHELNEFLLIDGEHVNDPHGGR